MPGKCPGSQGIWFWSNEDLLFQELYINFSINGLEQIVSNSDGQILPAGFKNDSHTGV